MVAEFSRASDAITAATVFQAANTGVNEELEGEIRPVLRVGVAMGEVVVADGTVTGEGIVLAQRLEQLAGPGGIRVQGAAYETIPKRLPFAYENLGEKDLKGFAEPVRVYAVSTQDQVDSTPRRSHVVPATASDSGADKPSIAVLPFTNMSRDPDQDYFCDGLTEDIITELSHHRDLFVTARNSSFAFREQLGVPGIEIADSGDCDQRIQ